MSQDTGGAHDSVSGQTPPLTKALFEDATRPVPTADAAGETEQDPISPVQREEPASADVTASTNPVILPISEPVKNLLKYEMG